MNITLLDYKILKSWIIDGFETDEDIPWYLFGCLQQLPLLIGQPYMDMMEMLVHTQMVVSGAEVVIVKHLPIGLCNWKNGKPAADGDVVEL